MYHALRLQVPKYDVSTQNQYYDSYIETLDTLYLGTLDALGIEMARGSGIGMRLASGLEDLK